LLLIWIVPYQFHQQQASEHSACDTVQNKLAKYLGHRNYCSLWTRACVTAARRFRDQKSGGKYDPHQRQLPVIEQMLAATRVMSALAAFSFLPRYDVRPRWRIAKSLTMHVEHTAPVAMTDLGSASAEAAGSWTLILPVFLFRDPPYALRPCVRLIPCNAMRCDAMSCFAQAKWGSRTDDSRRQGLSWDRKFAKRPAPARVRRAVTF
jgi:hypothetical protein